MANQTEQPERATCVVGGCTKPDCDGLHHTGAAGQQWTESEATYRAALRKRETNPWY